MTALAKNIVNSVSGSEQFDGPAAAAVHVFVGALVSVDSSGNHRPGRATATDHVIGIAYEECDNTDGIAGDKRVKSRARVGYFVNSAAADEIGPEDLGQVCFVVDDATVALTSNSGARPPAGMILGIEAGKVKVKVGDIRGADGDLLAASNLSDVADAAVARANLGANKGEIVCFLASVLAGTYYFPLPDRAITITKLKSTINQALGGADLTITASINTTAITDGVITVTQAGSAAGDHDEAVPSALNVTDATDNNLRLVLAGNTTAGTGAVLVEYTW